MLLQQVDAVARLLERRRRDIGRQRVGIDEGLHAQPLAASVRLQDEAPLAEGLARRLDEAALAGDHDGARDRSEEHTSELQSLMRTSYAVFCLKNKKHNK